MGTRNKNKIIEKKKSLRGHVGDEIISQHHLCEQPVVLYGLFDEETPEGKYESYDIYVEISGGLHCVNEGDTLFKKPSIKRIEKLVQEYLDEID